MTMVAEYMQETGMNDNDVNAKKDITLYQVKEPEIEQRIYRVCYPEEWALPSNRELYASYDMVKNRKYIPYKRLSHFREHLNRLQYCQFVTFPSTCWVVVCHVLSDKSIPEDDYYRVIRQEFKRQKLTRYNEHIHHLISRFTGAYLDISYDDRLLMCQLFCQLEQQFKRNSDQWKGRKNIFSYYLVLQLILYLFHYHSQYDMPTLYDTGKRECYYYQLLVFFSKTQLYQEIFYMHLKRKKQCFYCVNRSPHFDEILIKSL